MSSKRLCHNHDLSILSYTSAQLSLRPLWSSYAQRLRGFKVEKFVSREDMRTLDEGPSANSLWLWVLIIKDLYRPRDASFQGPSQEKNAVFILVEIATGAQWGRNFQDGKNHLVFYRINTRSAEAYLYTLSLCSAAGGLHRLRLARKIYCVNMIKAAKCRQQGQTVELEIFWFLRHG